MVISWKKSDANGANLQYLATGTHRLTSDTRVSVENADEKGSTLVISFANNDDVGDYICEVSSNPPATLRHHVSLMVRPSVSILKPPEEVYRIFHGEELALVCRGQGDPEPTISWKRERKKMPDGHEKILGAQVIYSNVTRKHSGTYVCEGDNRSGYIANDTIKIDVIHPPEITGEQAYIQENEGIKLELVCIVHASPRANVSWYKNGHLLQHSEGRITIEKLSRKYVLAIRNLDETRDAGTYSCHAVNGLGEYRENFHVQVATRDSVFDSFHQNSSRNWFEEYSLEHGTMADEHTQVEPILASSSSTPKFHISLLLLLPFVIIFSLVQFIF